MPRGDRYKLTGFTKGPKRTTKHLNSHVTALQDGLDRIADLENETDAGANQDFLNPIELDVNGEIGIGFYRGTAAVVEEDADEVS